MISEKKLAYYEHVASQNCSEECQKIITQLVDEVRKITALWRFTSAELREKTEHLEKEADWLAWHCETLSGHNPILRQGMSKEQWREDARKAVSDEE